MMSFKVTFCFLLLVVSSQSQSKSSFQTNSQQSKTSGRLRSSPFFTPRSANMPVKAVCVVSGDSSVKGTLVFEQQVYCVTF